ncbi:aminotransferase-like domain-containing protein [Curvivirga aplysinae]|uniref:aminotransferase-like domain-containing protein n=1 Tax=Curvivirga aplysinae TaxID=2529852 RepID=UPI0012BD3023|nr:PLP-dependent aminotransferase family protein [Curvivirga aplysinae]MTI09613.1 PLP-dependent aminotransferase family protein [Curvivirga aplysinae]
MTIRQPSWAPDLNQFKGPKYKAIADAMAADILNGKLSAGDKLPPHRELSWHLGVTVGTITRAYQEAERQGLVLGEVGRGTFITGETKSSSTRGKTTDFPIPYKNAPAQDDPNAPIQLDVGYPPPCGQEEALIQAMQTIMQSPNLTRLLSYQASAGMPEQREVTAQWVQNRFPRATKKNIVITNGAQHAVFAALSAVTNPGDIVVVEELNHVGIKSIARNLNIKLHGIACDDQGMIPEALEQYCKHHSVAALQTVCTPNNPTNISMTFERRKRIAEICIQYNVMIVEDDIFACLLEAPLPPLTDFAPNHGIYTSSISKILAPGLRVGYVSAPERLIPSIEAAIRATSGMASPLTVEVFCEWVRSGIAKDLGIRLHTEMKARHEIFKNRFDPLGANYRLPKWALHAWLEIPEPYMAADFVFSAQKRGVQISTSGAFVIGRGNVPQYVRVCLGAPRQRDTVTQAVDILADLYAEGSAGTDRSFY